jgi:hypothetical protein
LSTKARRLQIFAKHLSWSRLLPALCKPCDGQITVPISFVQIGNGEDDIKRFSIVSSKTLSFPAIRILSLKYPQPELLPRMQKKL